MIKKCKWFASKLSRSKTNKMIDTPECRSDSKEETTVTKCESDTSSSVIEKTQVHHQYTHETPNDEGCPDDVENGMGATNEIELPNRTESCGASRLRSKQRRPMRASDATESFECVYREDDVIHVEEEVVDSRDDCPSIPFPGLVRGKEKSDVCTCSSTRNALPHLHPSKWPQAPLLLRPQPNGGTRVLGIRKEGTPDQFLWKPGQIEPWWEVLQKEWGGDDNNKDYCHASAKARTTPEYCEYCVILPINNGCEKEAESLVVDFESSLFEGTLLFRLRETNGTTKEPYQDVTGYFSDKAIRYQVVLRGRFKSAMPFSDLITGTRLDRPCGKLPPKWVMWTAMKVIHFFAPQLQTQLEKIDRPLVLSPLGSAPRTIVVEDQSVDLKNTNGCLLSKEYDEPTEASTSILGRVNTVEDPLERARARRKLMDQWFIAQSDSPRVQMDKTYTFEFLQHLFDYQNFTIELGTSFHVKVKDILNGQPLQIMAEHHREGSKQLSTLDDHKHRLWSFQIWNECLWNDAMEHLNNEQSDAKN